jgi:hypothetical protein
MGVILMFKAQQQDTLTEQHTQTLTHAIMAEQQQYMNTRAVGQQAQQHKSTAQQAIYA